MANKELAQQIADLTDRTVSSIMHSIKQMDADQLINITAAVDDVDMDTVIDLLDQTEELANRDLTPREALSELNRLGRQALKNKDPMDALWDIIAVQRESDWRTIWPAVKQDIMQALYQEATDEDVDNISADMADEIYDYGQSFLKESMVMWNHQLCEVTVQRGPNRTVGIWDGSQTRMVNRCELTPVMEHVLGMTGMPQLGRIRELAGIDNPIPAPITPMSTKSTIKSDPDQIIHSMRQHLDELESLISSQNMLAAGVVEQQDHTMEETVLHARALSRKASALAERLNKRDRS
jgi:hypothetical protein